MPEFTRRQFMATAAFASGFALAVQPIAASVITTNAEGIVAGAVKIPVSDGEMPAYRAMPAKGTNFPIVLVIHEIFGVHAHIEDVCRRFAKLGYVAIAPQLFTRQGDVLKLSSVDKIRPIVAKVPDAQVMSDLDATAAWAAKASKGDAAKLAITGFCWGGRIVWLYATRTPTIKAGVAWYGRLVGEPNLLMPTHPVDVACALKVPVLGLYGGKDTGIPLTTVEQMRDRLKSSSSKSEIIVYPEAPHAFFADYRPSYREADAKDGWKRLQAWFKQNGA
ncbi:dienelactone hydrolase family protein [Phormidium sp. FACHB-592]|uniref:Dienelactone hydrolase family protein n=1 Tax=Stenomitos frigidus AS-A4 TaxID=2933935 RepID=A0ABV0KGU8_9CYAN|nr:dienelactone hydrolase family protein [Phormidium sp. FACHB-592]MBD2073778.1 dienelactone hydrolase family protein [Phormidium sp. FACHB-592]